MPERKREEGKIREGEEEIERKLDQEKNVCMC